jgi:hypothetical protein
MSKAKVYALPVPQEESERNVVTAPNSASVNGGEPCMTITRASAAMASRRCSDQPAPM